MRTRLTLAALTGLMLAGIASPAPAAQSPGTIVHATRSALPIIEADHRCGPGHHFVPRHRWHGRWVHAYCARNLRRHPPGY
ncbi:MAG: hypothetical protein PHI71_18705 [Acidiphilium sp.]|jgi:hypothetical protein|nr:hypothetical protein [Acidiphilium sp.]